MVVQIFWKLIISICLLFLGFIQESNGQSKLESIREDLVKLAPSNEAMKSEISISVTNIPLREFLRGVANSTGLNIDIEPTLDMLVSNNFHKVRVYDLIAFLINEFDLLYEYTGNIFSLKKNNIEITPDDPILVIYDPISTVISMDFNSLKLSEVTRKITHHSKRNIFISPGLEEKTVSAFIKEMPIEKALERFGFANDMKLEVTSDSVFIFNPNIETVSSPQISPTIVGRQAQSTRIRQPTLSTGYDLKMDIANNDTLSILAVNAPVGEVIMQVSEKMGKNFFIGSNIENLVTTNLSYVSYENFLDNILHGSEFNYKNINNTYVFGAYNNPEIRDVSVIQLFNRSINGLLSFIPENLIADVEIKEFPEQNSFVISGSQNRIKAINALIRNIDQVVPVIFIEVLIVDVNKSYTVATGISAGISNELEESRGNLFPNIDMNLNSSSINNIINKFNEFGMVNIGPVTQNFYLNIKALEDQGILNIRSTPQLSTLNGHTTSLSIGNTEYYVEEQSQFYGYQNPQLNTIKIINLLT
jgi:type IV pilus assembly protein PilQ